MPVGQKHRTYQASEMDVYLRTLNTSQVELDLSQNLTEFLKPCCWYCMWE